jgi:hypothetical protein
MFAVPGAMTEGGEPEPLTIKTTVGVAGGCGLATLNVTLTLVGIALPATSLQRTKPEYELPFVRPSTVVE